MTTGQFITAVGKELRRVRLAKKITQKALARNARITQPTLCRIERGESCGYFTTMCLLVRELGISLADLIPPEFHVASFNARGDTSPNGRERRTIPDRTQRGSGERQVPSGDHSQDSERNL